MKEKLYQLHFRSTYRTAVKLRELSEKRGLTRTELIERLIDAECKKEMEANGTAKISK